MAARILHREGVKIEKRVERPGSVEIRYVPDDGRILLEKTASKAGPVRALIIDDSKTINTLLAKVLSEDSGIEVVGTIDHPSLALEAIERLRPDVITLDIHMPGMDGVALLRSYLPRHPIPTVMISSISKEEGPAVLSALESGAVDYIQKPSFEQLASVVPLIREKVKNAAASRVVAPARTSSARRVAPVPFDPKRVLAIGSSTGGTEALKEVFLRMPEKIPAILVVQHIPAVFSRAFADRLNSLNPFEVKEAENGDEVRPGRVLIAPGGHQMRVAKVSGRCQVVVDKSPPVNRHQPSVDVLFESVAKVLGADAVGAILTGMGADGARGLLQMKETGSSTLAQDEASCVVYGMPQAAVKLGAADEVVPLLRMAEKLMESVRLRTAA
ncbi:MAG: chemotaxis response regulator protein-glutamate methylesterase [Bdellovibrionales bacterium]|nr:chemotaxis response regulator protein-glutamate methylesterase [Bdellovibrionales bacterium]